MESKWNQKENIYFLIFVCYITENFTNRKNLKGVMQKLSCHCECGAEINLDKLEVY